MDLEMNRENVIKLSIIGAVLLVAIVVVLVTLTSGGKEKVIEQAPVSEPGTAGPDRFRGG